MKGAFTENTRLCWDGGESRAVVASRAGLSGSWNVGVGGGAFRRKLSALGCLQRVACPPPVPIPMGPARPASPLGQRC